MRQNRGSMTHGAKKWLMFTLRWGVAVAGIWWVVSNMTLRDHVTILDEHNRPMGAMLVSGTELSASFQIVAPATGRQRVVARSQTINLPEQKYAALTARIGDDESRQTHVLGLDLSEDLRRVDHILISDPRSGDGIWIRPSDV